MSTNTAYGPYSPIRQAGNFYFSAGQVGVDPATKAAPKDVVAQTHQALKNLRSVLENADLNMNNIVKTTVFLRHMDDFAVVNDIYIHYFGEPRPARSCIEVASLPKVAGDTELLVEIEAVAYKEASQ